MWFFAKMLNEAGEHLLFAINGSLGSNVAEIHQPVEIASVKLGI
jgi:negative regulator of genetic competence, sporulation and motility